jgi:hypothetical protein
MRLCRRACTLFVLSSLAFSSVSPFMSPSRAKEKSHSPVPAAPRNGGLASAPEDEEGFAAMLQQAAQGLRAGAAKGRTEAASCRSLVAKEPGSTCVVKYKNPCNGQEVDLSVSEAEKLASEWEALATKIEARIPEIRRLEAKVYLDHAAVQKVALRHNFKKTTEEIFGWLSLSAEGHKTLREKAKEALIDLGFMVAKLPIDLTLDSNKFGEIVEELNKPAIAQAFSKKGINVQDLIKHLVELNTPGSKRPAEASVELILDKLLKVRDVVMLETDDGKQLLNVVMMILGWLIKSPALQVLVIELKLVGFIAFNTITQWVSLYNIERLTKLTEDELRGLNALMEQSERDWKALTTALESVPDPCGSRSPGVAAVRGTYFLKG